MTALAFGLVLTMPAADPLPDGAVMRLGKAAYVPGGCYALDLSPDGRRLATATSSEVRVWDAATGQVLARLPVGDRTERYQGPVARFTADGGVAVVAPNDQRLDIWRLGPDGPTGPRKVPPVDRPAGVHAFSLSADGTRLAYHGGSRVRVVDVVGRQVGEWEAANSAWVVLSGDGRVAAVSTGKQVRVVEVATGKELDAWAFDAKYPGVVALNRDGTRAVVHHGLRLTNDTNAVQLRDLSARRTTEVPAAVGGHARWVAVSPAGDRFAVLPAWWSPRPVLVCDAATGKVVQRVAGGRATAAAFSADGRTLAVVGGSGVLGLWDLESGRPKPGLADPPGAVRRLRFLDGGRTVAACGGWWVTWEAATGRKTDTLPAAGLAPELSPDGRRAAAFDDGRLTVTDTRTGAVVWSAVVPGPGRTFPYRFSPDGSRLVGRAEKAVHVWAAETGEAVATVPVEAGEVLAAVAPAARTVVVGATDPTRQEHNPIALAYDTATGRKLWEGGVTLDDPYTGIVSADGRWVAYVLYRRSGGGGGPAGLAVRDLATGRVRWETSDPRHRAPYSLALSPAGDLLALGTGSNGVAVYEVATGKPVCEFKHGSVVNALAFSPDGMTLAAASPDAPVYLWDVYRTRTRTGPPPDADAVRQAVAALGGDPKTAFGAVQTLHAAPAEAVAVLRAAVKPAVGPDPEAVKQWIAELADEDFAVRETAEKELTRQAPLVADAARAARSAKPTPEQDRRLARVLTAADKPTADDLRGVRAVGVLMRIGTPEAVAGLKELAAGAAGAEVTRSAAEALKWVGR